MDKKRKIRKFLIKHKRLIIAAAIVFILFILFGGYRIWLNIHFLITDDLLINLNPNDISLSILYNERPEVSFDAEIENSIFCSTYCSYEFTDLSTSALVEEGNFTAKGANKKFEKGFGLSVDYIGTGQKLYRFDVACRNIRSWHCLTNGAKRQRSAFVTLNYDISSFEKQLKEELRGNLTQTLFRLSHLYTRVEGFNKQFFELGFRINLNEISGEKEIINQEFSDLVVDIENLRRVWSSQNFTLLAELYDKDYSLRIENLGKELSSLEGRLNDLLKMHNSLVEELNQLDESLRLMNETLLFLHGSKNDLLVKKHKQILSDLKGTRDEVNKNTFSNYSSVQNKLESLQASTENLLKESKDLYIEAFTRGFYAILLEKDILCGIKGLCLSKNSISSISEQFFNADNSEIEGFCSTIEDLKGIYAKENNKSLETAKNFNSDEEKIAEEIKNKKIQEIKKGHFDELQNITAQNDNQNQSLKLLLGFTFGFDNVSIDGGDFGGYQEPDILSIIQLNLTEYSEEYYDSYCTAEGKLNFTAYFVNKTELEKVEMPVAGNISSRIETMLPETFPVCCIFNECRRCCQDEECRQDPLLYPVLVLHGHSFNSDNSPDYSLDAFNKLIANLELDGYINAGTITPISDYSEINKGEWGLSSKPISVKGSYYLVSYYNIGGYTIAQQKSENIETYAIRLKELIDLLKFRTGRGKVIIIAHSMGGLVARSYMQIFGDNDVDKLIMIATPNKGISGSVSDYCPILGEKKECNDMSQGSIFIKRLDDPLKIPKNAKLFNIVGLGCEMKNGNGDGVVRKENAELGYAENFYVNGNCSKFEVLHTQILDTGKHPKVYDFIKEALKK